jgi:hypothetical protein
LIAGQSAASPTAGSCGAASAERAPAETSTGGAQVDRHAWTEHERKFYQSMGSYGSKPVEVVQWRQNYEIDADIYEAETRRLVTHLRLDGPIPPPLPKESKGDPMRRGPRATASAVLSALQPTIQGR